MAQACEKPEVIILPKTEEDVIEPVEVQKPIQKKSVKSKLSKLFKKAKLNPKYLEHTIPIEKVKSQVSYGNYTYRVY
jgi:hypothetical protein